MVALPEMASQLCPNRYRRPQHIHAQLDDSITEIGQRYGTNLDGFFFDDGMVLYYPASFEQLHTAARTGNPNRLISWNDYVFPRVTDFQDVWFGEGSHGQSQNGSAAAGGNGVFTSGPTKGCCNTACPR